MGIFQRVHKAEAPPVAQRDAGTWGFALPGNVETNRMLEGWPQHQAGAAGMGVPTLFKCAELVSTKVGKFRPIAKYQGEELPVLPAVLEQPDPNMSRWEFLSSSASSMIHRGNAYWWVIRQGAVVTLELIHPDKVSTRWADSSRRRRLFTVQGHTGQFTEDQIIAVPYYRPYGMLSGLGPVGAARALWTGQSAADHLVKSNFTDGVFPTGVVSSDGAVGIPEAKALEIKRKFQDNHAGDRGVVVLTGSAKFEPLTVSAKDAQWIEARQWGAGDIARACGVPAGLLDLPVGGSNLTYSNLADARTNFLHLGLDGPLCQLGNALGKVTPFGVDVEWYTADYEPVTTEESSNTND